MVVILNSYTKYKKLYVIFVMLQENGFIVAEYDTGNGKQILRIDSKTYNDGKYHVVKFLRNGERADLIVDSLSAFNLHQCEFASFIIYNVFILPRHVFNLLFNFYQLLIQISTRCIKCLLEATPTPPIPPF